MVYTCNRCLYVTSNLERFREHCQRSYRCKPGPGREDEDPRRQFAELIANKRAAKPFECMHCHRALANGPSLSRHIHHYCPVLRTRGWLPTVPGARHGRSIAPEGTSSVTAINNTVDNSNNNSNNTTVNNNSSTTVINICLNHTHTV